MRGIGNNYRLDGGGSSIANPGRVWSGHFGQATLYHLLQLRPHNIIQSLLAPRSNVLNVPIQRSKKILPVKFTDTVNLRVLVQNPAHPIGARFHVAANAKELSGHLSLTQDRLAIKLQNSRWNLLAFVRKMLA